MNRLESSQPTAAACPFSAAKGPAQAASPGKLPRTVPVNKGLPLIGALIDIFRDGPGLLTRLAAQHPDPIFAVHFGPMPVYIVSHPEHVQEVLVDRSRDFPKGPMWRGVRQFVGDGLVLVEGERGLQRRRLLQPVFSARSLSTIVPTMVKAIERGLDHISQAAARGPVELQGKMSELLQELLLESILGSSLRPGEVQSLARQLAITVEEISLRIFLYFLPDGFPLPGARRFRKAIATADQAVARIVGVRRRNGEKHNDLLGLLLAARDDETPNGIGERVLRDELVSFFLAGAATMSNTLTWLWYLLDQHPEVERRVRAEVDAVVGNRNPCFEDLASLEYTKRVFQETTRLYPASWAYPRYAEHETTIGGYRIPARSVLLISPYLTHRTPGIWEQPERFDPDRFLPERLEALPRLAYSPFGAGPHLCIGMTLAAMEAQLIVAMMVRRFRMRVVPGQKIVAGPTATIQPRYGLMTRIEPRS